MAMSFAQVRHMLLAFEPDYPAMARLGPQLLPHLRQLVSGRDKMLASKAAYLASLVDHPQAVDVVRAAAQSASAPVRVAAAGALRNLRHPAAAGAILALLNDRDPGVRKFAVKASAARPNSALLAKVGHISRQDPAPALRALASQVLSRSRLA
jgi:HEAT repeat protein